MFGELQCPGPTNASTRSRNFGTTDLAPLSSRNKSARQRATPSSAKSTGLASPAAQPPRAHPAPRGQHRSFGPARRQKTSARGHAHAEPLRRPPCRTKAKAARRFARTRPRAGNPRHRANPDRAQLPLARRRSETSGLSFLRTPENGIARTLLRRARRNRFPLTPIPPFPQLSKRTDHDTSCSSAGCARLPARPSKHQSRQSLIRRRSTSSFT